MIEIILYITCFILFLIIFILNIVISKTIKLSGLFSYYKAFKGYNKGLILIRVYFKSGKIIYRVGKSKGSEFVEVDLKKDGNIASYPLISEYVYINEIGLRCLDVFENDIEPRSWFNKVTEPLSPFHLRNSVTNSIKSEKISSPLEDFIKKYGYYIGLGVIIIIGIMGFVMMQQNDTIVDLSKQLAGININVV